MLRIGLIGCGAHCIEAHAPALIDFAERHPATIAPAAACDLDHTRAEDFVRRYGFAAAYTDVGEMLAAERLDGALSIMPVDRIVDTSLYLFECGMPCIIEKPLATTIADLDRLRTAARSAAAPHQVSLNRRFMPMAIKALAWCRDRGPVVKVNGRILRHRRARPRPGIESPGQTNVRRVGSPHPKRRPRFARRRLFVDRRSHPGVC